MRKFCLGISFLLLLLSATSFNQLFRIPILVAHFVEHQKIDQNIGFLNFLSMHYGGYDQNDEDNDRDMQLPFKSVDQHCCNQVVIMPPALELVENQSSSAPAQDQPVYSDSDIADPTLSSLFRPPRA